MHVSLPALPMIVDNDGLGVWFLSYVNGLGTYLLRYLEVKSAHPLSLDLFWLLDLSTSWLILVSDSDSYSYYTVCPLFTSFVFLTQSSTTLTRLVAFDSFLSAWPTDHWSFVSLSTLLTLSTWLAHLVLLVESTLSLLDLFVTCHYPSPWLARPLVCLTCLSAWLTTSMTRSSCQLDLFRLTCLSAFCLLDSLALTCSSA